MSIVKKSIRNFSDSSLTHGCSNDALRRTIHEMAEQAITFGYRVFTNVETMNALRLMRRDKARDADVFVETYDCIHVFEGAMGRSALLNRFRASSPRRSAPTTNACRIQPSRHRPGKRYRRVYRSHGLWRDVQHHQYSRQICRITSCRRDKRRITNISWVVLRNRS